MLILGSETDETLDFGGCRYIELIILSLDSKEHSRTECTNQVLLRVVPSILIPVTY